MFGFLFYDQCSRALGFGLLGKSKLKDTHKTVDRGLLIQSSILTCVLELCAVFLVVGSCVRVEQFRNSGPVPKSPEAHNLGQVDPTLVP